MRYVAVDPHTPEATWTQEAAEQLVGKTVPFTVEFGEAIGTAKVLAARVDKMGLHIEVEVESDEPDGRKLTNLAFYGSPHGPREKLPSAPEFSLRPGYSIPAEVDPLLRIGCVLPSSTLDDHVNRDALREIVRAATKRFYEENP